jgi:hypothetical protein
MVRGNWQKRVEKAEARRQETKQRKQKSEDKRAFKGWVRNLLQELDAHQVEFLRYYDSHLNHNNNNKKKQTTTSPGGAGVLVVHIWTDTLPSTGPPLLDLLEQQQQQQHHQQQHRQHHPLLQPQPTKTHHKKQHKKVHPRSKEASEHNGTDTFATTAATAASAAADTMVLPCLCQTQFVHGKCHTKSCKHFHYPNVVTATTGSVSATTTTSPSLSSSTDEYNSHSFVNLAQIIHNKTVLKNVETALWMHAHAATGGEFVSSSVKTPITAVGGAGGAGAGATDRITATTNEGMDMLYYLRLNLVPIKESQQEPNEQPQDPMPLSPSEQIMAELNRTQTLQVRRHPFCFESYPLLFILCVSLKTYDYVCMCLWSLVVGHYHVGHQSLRLSM